MYPQQMIAGGTFALTTALIASGVEIELQSQGPTPDYIEIKSLGKAGAFNEGWGQSGDAQAIEWWWARGMPQQAAKGILQASEASTPQLPAMTAYTITSSGISCYDTANPPTFAALATTAITGSAGTYVVSMASTGSIAVGDYVLLYATTGELQIAGYSFQVTAVTANVSITLGYMASSGTVLAADATAGFVKKYIPNRYYPKEKRIANITQAAQAVVFFTEKNDFTPGEQVSFRVPSEWGMTELNNVKARVLSVTNSATVSSITLDLDSSGFSAFVFPTSAVAAAGISPAVAVPSASMVVPDPLNTSLVQQPPGTNLLDAFDNRNVRLIKFGPGLFNVSAHTSEAEDIWMWRAFKYDLFNNN